MKVISYLNSEIPGTNLYDLDLEEFAKDNQEYCEEVLFYGYRILEKGLSKAKVRSCFRKIKYLNVTMPTEYSSDNFIHDANGVFDEIYGICPFSCHWMNKLEGSNRYKYIFYPVSIPNGVNPLAKKDYDVIYHGGIHNVKYLHMLEIFKQFNYRYITMTKGINQLTGLALPMATNINLSPVDKYKVISNCKISICFNSYPVGTEAIENIKRRPRWEENQAFNDLNNGYVPQFKSRFNEAAALGTLNLVEKDNWNLVEDFYEEGKDFIYFESMEDMEKKIGEVLSNWEKYDDMRLSALQKSKLFTRNNLYYRIMKSECWNSKHTPIQV
ncbi:glycosyltransferase [Prochlorococcus sp. MIT 1300]|uniref:glycosyltransferase n=1 Tax=Prochlorococcus sp. MIT 1300 TaxID=3096218 RepID=UPI002A74BBD6|nr:glycosyltransferase [Prochlorococcus sp. MIT 1300]